MAQYDPTYKRELWATYLGISLIVVIIIIPVLLFRNNESDNFMQSEMFVLFTGAIRALAAVTVFKIAKRQNRNKVMWCILAAMSPGIILIIIGLLRKVYMSSPDFSTNVMKPDNTQTCKEYKHEINLACNDKGLYGFVDKNGEVIIPFQYSGGEEFSEGLAVVYNKGGKFDKYGFIDTSGRMIIPQEFDYADSFSEGLACIRKNNFFGFINKEGQIVIDCLLKSATSFKNGVAEVKLGRDTYYINQKGEDVDPN